jgi:hypothetical protein
MSTTSTLSFANTFSPSTLAESAKVMQNFTAVSTLINTTGLGTNNIKDNTITAAKLEDGAITTAKILDANVTRAKLAALGQQTSSASGTFTTTNTSFTAVTNLSISITTVGRPVFLSMIADVANPAAVYGTSTDEHTLILKRGSTEVARWGVNNSRVAPGGFMFIDQPAAGTYTYTIEAKAPAAQTISVFHCKLMGFEL